VERRSHSGSRHDSIEPSVACWRGRRFAQPLSRGYGNGVRVAAYICQTESTAWPNSIIKLAWFERLIRHAATLYAGSQPVVLAGDYNVVPTDFDIYDPRSVRKTPCCSPRRAIVTIVCSLKDGSMRYGHVSRTKDLHLLGLLSPALAKELRHAIEYLF